MAIMPEGIETMLNAIKAAIGKLARKPALPAVKPLQSRKHIRITHWAFHATIAYYGDNGRKLTKRVVRNGDIHRLAKQARVNGYRVIG